jgi:hypothetical protein
MGMCVLTLTDDPDGMVEMSVMFRGGYDGKSHAHGQMGRIIMDIEQHAASKQEISTKLVEPENTSLVLTDA